MSEQKHSERLTYFRIERPSEWLMDDFAREAKKLEATIESQERDIAELVEALTEAEEIVREVSEDMGLSYSNAVSCADTCQKALSKHKDSK